ncbi:MAG: hypothetical protein J6S96_03580 [Muribaculaceae bacterium]|nr:hypothetical protein [Muribaculaceae bacterium]
MKIIICVFLINVAVIGCMANNNCTGDFVASIEFTHFGKVPIYEIIIQIYDSDSLSSRVHLIKEVPDSLYGSCELLESDQEKLIHYIEAIYSKKPVDDYIFYEKSEWAVSSTRDIITITLDNGQEYRYILGDTNSKAIQLVGEYLVQYTESFRKLANLVYNIYNRMIFYYIKDNKYVAYPE